MPETFLDENASGSNWAAEPSGNVMFAFCDRDKWREVRLTRCLRRALAAALLAAGLMVNTPAIAQDKKPNILFVLMDNLGYGELGVYGGGILRGAPTPPHRRACGRRDAAHQLQRRGPVHAEPLGHHDRAVFDPLRHAVGSDRRGV
jgi:hypothetical protein